ncbi:MAG TPA: MATE family efflux transporter [Sutterella sp.]|nr:MATE family efflux transporter [Sutterella sp.]
MTKLKAPDISYRAIARLATPLWIANVCIIGGGTIDTIMAGHLGSADLAGVALGAASMTCVFLALAGVLNGLSPIVGHHYGARRKDLIGFELSQSLWLVVALSIIGMLILGNTWIWTGLSQVTGRVKDVAEVFLLVSVLGIPAVLASRSMVSVFSAVSKPRITMYVSAANLALKAPLNAVFMYGFGPIEGLGGAGAAISSTILVWLSLAIYVLAWKKDSFYAEMQCTRWYMPDMKSLKEQLKIGIPIGITTFFESSSFTFMAVFIGRLGPVTLAAHQIVANITALCFMVPLSIGITSSVLVAQSLGARHSEVAYLAMVRTLKAVTAIALTVSVTLYFAQDLVFDIFTNEETVAKTAAPLLLFGIFYHVFDSLQGVASFALRGYRVTFIPMVIYGIFLWGLGLSGGYYLAFYAQWLGGPFGASGFWGMTSISLMIVGLMLLVYALWIGKNRIREARAKEEDTDDLEI